MKTATLNRAIREAERFILLAKETTPSIGYNGKSEWIEAGKHAATTKRASMDLTRALADLRQTK